MTDHANTFAIGQRVLFKRGRPPQPNARWHSGTVVAVTDTSEQYGAQQTGCVRVYSVRPDPGETTPAELICNCNGLIVEKDHRHRWGPGTAIRHQHELQLLWEDSGGDITFASGKPLEDTDCATLRLPDGREVTIRPLDLLRWGLGEEYLTSPRPKELMQ